jgi:hydroxymethylpyrimidine pyrophosphatase-like HAD family hydrolase
VTSPGRVAYLDLDGTLLGPGGSLLRGADGRFSAAGVRALERLSGAGVPAVLVSGRAARHLREAARLLGADGALPELGALGAGYPVPDGMSVHQAIAATGVPERLLAAEPGLEVHPASVGLREGTHCFRGRAGPQAEGFVTRASAGALRLVDNGVIDGAGNRVYHLTPTAASKATAVAGDIAARGADPAACLAVGDSPEDLRIAAVVGHFALVANALAANGGGLEDAGDVWVTRAAHGAGVLEAVEDWLAGRR